MVAAGSQSMVHSTGSKSGSRAAMIAQQARLLFSAYRKGDFADPDSFVLQLGLVLERYSDEIIAAVCSPLTGLQRRRREPPSLAHVVEACEDESKRRERTAKLATLRTAPRQARVPQHRANVFVARSTPFYGPMCEKAAQPGVTPQDYRYDERRDGLWVPRGWLERDDNTGGWHRPKAGRA